MSAIDPLQPTAALQAEVRRDCAQIKRARRVRFGLMCVAALAGTLGFGFAAGLKSPAAGSVTHVLVLVGYLVAGALLMGLAFGVRLPSGRRLFPVVGLSLLAALLLIGATVDNTAGPPFFAGAHCLGTGLMVSAALLVVALSVGGRVLRRHAPTGLMLGVSAGLFGLVPLHLACGSCAAAHVLTWHASVPVLSGVFAGLAWALLRPED